MKVNISNIIVSINKNQEKEIYRELEKNGISRDNIENLKYLKKSLNTNDELSTREKFTLYQELFPPRGGLSDIHYWHNDFGTRKTVNEVISDSTKTIADYLLEQ